MKYFKFLFIFSLIIFIVNCNLQNNQDVIKKEPGTYNINSIFYSWTYSNVTMTLYIDKIEILTDYSFKIYITWKANITTGSYEYIDKGSDEYNVNMNCTDNLNNRYDHIANYGVGYFRLYDEQSQSGWFLFPTLNLNATSIIFHDDDQQKVYEIQLID